MIAIPLERPTTPEKATQEALSGQILEKLQLLRELRALIDANDTPDGLDVTIIRDIKALDFSNLTIGLTQTDDGLSLTVA